ncbi:amidohydrolase family protein [Agromyces sp. Leaf222]|uniref:amidohydrolase family protein n=1 Tax=Agromyces sp. Leaf222 TaxID=1735688 RepID=UPI0006F27C34|nr:amidohydrolase family protein [Agromyces sp. Leaf222]KQM83585.1 hypothetical protein ASE68_10470 [Agromyces sp. Leaf222]
MPLTLGRPPFLVEFPVDTFRSLVDAVYAGVLDRHPDLKIIAAHCGGALPALAWRVSSLALVNALEGARCRISPLLMVEHGTLEVYPGAPHGIYGDDQAALDQDILDFINHLSRVSRGHLP